MRVGDLGAVSVGRRRVTGPDDPAHVPGEGVGPVISPASGDSAHGDWRPWADRSGVRAWAGLAVVLLGWATLYRETVAGMAAIWWRSETFAHGMVVAPISVWLIWRSEIWRYFGTARPTLAALPVAALMGVLWLAGSLASVAAVMQLAVTGLLISVVWGVLGHGLAAALAFPLGFLLFAVPLGEAMVPFLMDRTADFTVWALRSTGVPVFQEGLHFVLPNGRWSVVEACSGIRYLIASFMVGTLYAYLSYSSGRKRWLFIGFSILLPIVANWVRAYLIVMIGYLSDNRLAAGVDHLIYGWVFFGVVIVAMFWIGNRWRDEEAGIAPAAEDSVPPAAAGASVVTVLALLVVLAGPVAVAGIMQPSDDPVSIELVLPAGTSPWVESDLQALDYAPRLVGQRALSLRTYRDGDAEIDLRVAAFARQAEGRELVNWANSVIPDNDREQRWILLEQRTIEASIGRVRYARIRGAGNDVVVFSWYNIDGHVVASDFEAKLRLGLTRLRGDADTSFLVVAATWDAGPAEVRRRFEHFLAAQWPSIAQALEASAGTVE